jgi:hypothetical protein
MAAGAVGLSLAVTAPAYADLGANFSVNQNCGIPGALSPCSESGGTLTDVDSINFRYSAVIDQQNDGGPLNGDAFTEKGFAIWSGYFRDDGTSTGDNQLGDDYSVYMIFEGTGTATVDGPGILATFNTFNVSIFMSDGVESDLSLPADTTGDVDTDTDNDGSDAEDVLLATASLLSAGEAHLFGGLANGDFKIIMSDLGLSLLGEDFFTDPENFYKIMGFTGVTTQIIGASATEAFTATATGSGDLFFQVPEPGTLGLLGGGLLGAAALLRRRKAAKAA